MRSSDIREGLKVESLLLRVERSQLRWVGHLNRMPSGSLPREVYQIGPLGKRPPGRPRRSWRKYISALAEEHLGIPESELANAAGERKA